MTNLYVRSTTGNNGNDGLTWATAKADLAGAAAIDAGGDTVFVSQAHAEITAGAVSWTWNGVTATPVRIICGNDAAEPPTAVAASGTVATTGNSSITVAGTIYNYGLTYTAGNSTGTANFQLASNSQRIQQFENCNFIHGSTGSSNLIIGQTGNDSDVVELLNSNYKLSGTGQGIIARHKFIWRGGAMIAGTSTPSTALIARPTMLNASAGDILVEGVDLSALGSTVNIFTMASDGRAVIRNCKLPASWSGSLISGTIVPGARAELYNCSDGDINYAMWAQDITGSVKAQAAIFRNGGASDGITPIAWSMATTSIASYPLFALTTPEIFAFNATLGVPKTLTVEILHDSLTALKDNEVWLEVEYQGTNGFPLALFASDAPATILTTAVDQTASAAAWTNAMSNPNAQKLSVTITPRETGVYICRVKLAKATYTIYVDPVVTVS